MKWNLTSPLEGVNVQRKEKVETEGLSFHTSVWNIQASENLAASNFSTPPGVKSHFMQLDWRINNLTQRPDDRRNTDTETVYHVRSEVFVKPLIAAPQL